MYTGPPPVPQGEDSFVYSRRRRKRLSSFRCPIRQPPLSDVDSTLEFPRFHSEHGDNNIVSSLGLRTTLYPFQTEYRYFREGQQFPLEPRFRQVL